MYVCVLCLVFGRRSNFEGKGVLGECSVCIITEL